MRLTIFRVILIHVDPDKAHANMYAMVASWASSFVAKLYRLGVVMRCLSLSVEFAEDVQLPDDLSNIWHDGYHNEINGLLWLYSRFF